MADLGIYKGGFQGGHIHCIGGGRMLQLGVPKIYGGSSRCGMLILGGSEKILKIRCQEIEFGGIFGGFSC